MKHRVWIAIVGCALLAMGLALPALGAHGSNSKAILEGAPAAGIQGIAIVNLAAGNGNWTGGATVQGLAPGEYVYAVSLNDAAPMVICEFSAEANGQAGCSAVLDQLGGFNTALIVDLAGNVVASGVFERRGGQRSQTPARQR